MTPKEKAWKLIEDMSFFELGVIDPQTLKIIPYSVPSNPHAKECALLAVDELISSNNKWDDNAQTNTEEYYYWVEVKKEIEIM